jgi:hypothetical protein
MFPPATSSSFPPSIQEWYDVRSQLGGGGKYTMIPDEVEPGRRHERRELLDELERLLTAHGADLDAASPGGRTLPDRALAQGWVDFVALLRAHGARTGTELREGS